MQMRYQIVRGTKPERMQAGLGQRKQQLRVSIEAGMRPPVGKDKHTRGIAQTLGRLLNLLQVLGLQTGQAAGLVWCCGRRRNSAL